MRFYHVTYSKEAIKELKKLDTYVSRLIIAWMNKNIDGCSDPKAHGEGLSANRVGQWRYRVGDYRVLCDIKDDEVLVLVLTVGHRKNVY